MIKKVVFTLCLLFFVSVLYADTEYVTLIKVLDSGDQGIIERSNGERWLIEKGIGAISFWRFEGKKILIDSPNMFCGIGSKVILPELGQEARIWNAELIDLIGSRKVNAVSSIVTADPELTARALTFLGYYDLNAKEDLKSDISLALKAFQKEHGLSQTGIPSGPTQLALSKAIIALKPLTRTSLELASALLDSASRQIAPSQGSGVPWPNQPLDSSNQNVLVDTHIDGEFEGWEGDTIVKLMNGQIWQQSEYYYHYHYSYMPKVIIISTGGQFKMIVDGIPKAIGVTKLK
jgi:hypothetical protein